MERPTNAQIVSDPRPFGLSWEHGTLHRKGMHLTDNAPYLKITDLDLCRTAFGDESVKRWINNSSLKVECQKLRNDIYEDRGLLKQENAMREIAANYAFGTTARRRTVTIVEKIVEKKTFVANDGTEFPTLAEVLAHNVDLALAAGETEE